MLIETHTITFIPTFAGRMLVANPFLGAAASIEGIEEVAALQRPTELDGAVTKAKLIEPRTDTLLAFGPSGS